LAVLSLWVLGEQSRSTGPFVLLASSADELDAPPIELQIDANVVTVATNEHATSAASVPTQPVAAAIALSTPGGDARSSARGTFDEVRELGRNAARYGPTAEFFGAVAYGDRFVFVLDVSGSMGEGSRLLRAGKELLRSLESLGEDQAFHIVLFSDGARAMLDVSPGEASLTAATEANKQQARAWLATVRPDGWSDPRDALQLALELKPSAIFLLSDGEFKTGPPLRKLGSTAQRLARRRNTSATPIHTIAYEDPINKRTLRGIAQGSGGTYRYIPPPCHGP
jgi:Mg-chelatase subunit ChlD